MRGAKAGHYDAGPPLSSRILHIKGDIGPAMFEHACKLGLEGIVSKHRDRAYRAGRSSNWIKIKNPASPAMVRVEDGSW